MTPEADTLSEQEALRLWQRAAQLQADAARRAEARAAGEVDAGPGTSVARRESDGYALAHVRAAALEAGISEEFVDAALAELQADRALAASAPVRGGRISEWVLGSPPAFVEARRVVRAEPRAVLAAMEEILPAEPYTLTLKDRLGEPADGGTLVFEIQGVGFTTGGQGFKGDAAFADLREVYATLHPLPGEPGRTELVLRSPVAWARRINAVIIGGLCGVGGFLGLAAGFAVGSMLGPAVAGVVAATGAAAGGGLSLSAWQRLHRYGLRRGAKALEGAAAALAARAEGGWGFLPPKPPRVPPAGRTPPEGPPTAV